MTLDILKIVTFGIVAATLIVLVNQDSSGKIYGQLIRIGVVAILMIFIVSQLAVVFDVIKELAQKIKIDDTYLNIVLKIIGIAYIAEFGYQLCKDAGEEAIGSRVQFAGKVMIFVIASPVILAFVELVTDLL